MTFMDKLPFHRARGNQKHVTQRRKGAKNAKKTRKSFSSSLCALVPPRGKRLFSAQAPPIGVRETLLAPVPTLVD
jgi:hypothetical protein